MHKCIEGRIDAGYTRLSPGKAKIKELIAYIYKGWPEGAVAQMLRIPTIVNF